MIFSEEKIKFKSDIGKTFGLNPLKQVNDF